MDYIIKACYINAVRLYKDGLITKQRLMEYEEKIRQASNIERGAFKIK